MCSNGSRQVAELVGLQPAGIAIVESATAALKTLLDAWPLASGAEVAVSANEWGNNRSILADRGLGIVELETDPVESGAPRSGAAARFQAAGDRAPHPGGCPPRIGAATRRGAVALPGSGRPTVGRRRAFTDAQQREAQRLYDLREVGVDQIARAVGSGAPTLYRYLELDKRDHHGR